jgi:hypothetical protein
MYIWFTCSTRQNIASVEVCSFEIYITHFYGYWSIFNILYWYLHIDMRDIIYLFIYLFIKVEIDNFNTN